MQSNHRFGSSRLMATALVNFCLFALPTPGETSAFNCPQEALVEGQSLCTDQGGIPITGSGQRACIEDKAVQDACGIGGRFTRLHAWSEWLKQLKTFQDQCADRGGEFAYVKPGFKEPTDESFCFAAEPEMGSSFFEDSTCNYRSVCPSVPVVCNLPCNENGAASLPNGQSTEQLTRR